jgi:hypothetical protein
MENIKYTVQEKDLDSIQSINRLASQDKALLKELKQPSVFNPQTDRIEAHFYTLNERLLKSIHNFKDYSILEDSPISNQIGEITLNPERDAVTQGYVQGDVKIVYNFLRNIYSDSAEQRPAFL